MCGWAEGEGFFFYPPGFGEDGVEAFCEFVCVGGTGAFDADFIFLDAGGIVGGKGLGDSAGGWGDFDEGGCWGCHCGSDGGDDDDE